MYGTGKEPSKLAVLVIKFADSTPPSQITRSGCLDTKKEIGAECHANPNKKSSQTCTEKRVEHAGTYENKTMHAGETKREISTVPSPEPRKFLVRTCSPRHTRAYLVHSKIPSVEIQHRV